MSRVHIIGGGLAGLSAAVELAPQAQVTLYEAGPACGGRARSFYDKTLDTVIDNGNHLMLSANPCTFRYLDLLGATDTLQGPGKPIFPWFDLRDRCAWTVRLSPGKIPFWLLNARRRVPGMTLKETTALVRLMRADDEAVVADCLSDGELARRLLEPFAVSVMNTTTDQSSAALLGNVVRRTLAQGGDACCPWMAAHGLSESFVIPALAYLSQYHADIRTSTRVTALKRERGRVVGFETSGGEVALGPEDAVIMAVPAPIATGLLPEIKGPNQFEAIANAHFRIPFRLKPRGVVAQARFVGLIGGIAEWVFVHDDVLSVTVSAASRYTQYSQEAMLKTIWSEISQALNPVLDISLPQTMPAARLIREKRATFAATPEQNRRRPGPATPYINLALAGDWTDTGLPATIEGAIQSGLAAVDAVGFRAEKTVKSVA